MGGGKGAKGSSISISEPTPEQRETQRYFLEDVAKPVGGELIPQVVEALRTGGVNAQIPAIARAVESVQQANARSQSATQGSLASSRLQGTPFGQSILASQRQAGAQEAGLVPIDFAQMFLQMAQPLVTGGGSVSISGPGISRSQSKQTGGSDPVLELLTSVGGGLGRGIGGPLGTRLFGP